MYVLHYYNSYVMACQKHACNKVITNFELC